MKPGGLVPGFRMGPFDRRIMRVGHEWRDYAAEHPTLTRFMFGAQHAVALVEQAVRGKELMYQEEAKIRAAKDVGYRYHEACQHCHARDICDGFHGDYADLFGTEEAAPITDVPVTKDPTFFIRDQEKVVEPEDEAWAL